MAYKHYTSCFQYPSGGKPYNEKDRTAFVITQLLSALAIIGIFTVAGLLAGPIGAIFGAFGLPGIPQRMRGRRGYPPPRRLPRRPGLLAARCRSRDRPAGSGRAASRER